MAPPMATNRRCVSPSHQSGGQPGQAFQLLQVTDRLRAAVLLQLLRHLCHPASAGQYPSLMADLLNPFGLAGCRDADEVAGFELIAVALHRDHFDVVDEPVENGCGDDVAEDLTSGRWACCW